MHPRVCSLPSSVHWTETWSPQRLQCRAVRRAPELIPGVPHTSRSSRSSWDPSRSIPAYPGRLVAEKMFCVKTINVQKMYCLPTKCFPDKKHVSKNELHTTLPGPAQAVKGRAQFYFGDDILFFFGNDIIFTKNQCFHQKLVQDKPESIGNGLTSSGPVYLYRPYPR